MNRIGMGSLSLILLLLLLGCGAGTFIEGPVLQTTGALEEPLPTRTPEPTATPGPVARGVEAAAASAGLGRATFLGLATPDWINLAISFVLVLLAYLLGTLLIRRILPPITRRTPSVLDDKLLSTIGSDLRWLLVVATLIFATQRLAFIGADLKHLLRDLYYVAAVVIGLHASWRLIDSVVEWYREQVVPAEHEDQYGPIITLLTRVARALLVVTALTILLAHFGINVTVIAVVLVVGALAISLGARDTVADAIAGFIILVDRPFRIGDRVEIQKEGTWGDVAEIGLRTTRILTRDNRMVVVPNSLIARNQVVNFSYPDPRYRIETTVSIAYGTDIEVVERLIIDAVLQVSGVLPEEPVQVLYDKMGDWAMTLCIRWWIESYADARRMHDQVHRALQKTLDAAGIEMPYPTQSLHLHGESEVTDGNAT